MVNARRSGHRAESRVVAAASVALAVAISLLLPSGNLLAQLPPLKPAHLNPMIEKLAAGQAVFGPIISDFSVSSAHTWAR